MADTHMDTDNNDTILPAELYIQLYKRIQDKKRKINKRNKKDRQSHNKDKKKDKNKKIKAVCNITAGLAGIYTANNRQRMQRMPHTKLKADTAYTYPAGNHSIDNKHALQKTENQQNHNKTDNLQEKDHRDGKTQDMPQLLLQKNIDGYDCIGADSAAVLILLKMPCSDMQRPC